MKLAWIGRSMISPFGLAIRPRIPASWRICLNDPRAPELAIMKIGFSLWRFASMASATASVASVQMSMIDSLRSSSVMRPRSYCCSTRPTRSSYDGEDLRLVGRDHDVVLRDRDAGLRRVLEAERLDRVEHARDQVRPVASGEVGDEVVHLLLRQRAVDEREVVELSLALIECLLERPLDLEREDDAARSGQPDLLGALARYSIGSCSLIWSDSSAYSTSSSDWKRLMPLRPSFFASFSDVVSTRSCSEYVRK